MRYSVLCTLFLMILLYPIFVCAQCRQEVLVLEYRGVKEPRPLANVEIIVSNAGSSVTDKQGRCTLTFNTLKVGDKVTCRRITKIGYEVFDKDALNLWYITNDKEPFTIMMCQTEFINELRTKYREGATISVYADFKNREKVLVNSHKSGSINAETYNKQLEKLQQEYDAKLTQIDTYIDQLAHANLRSIQQSEKLILEMLKKGDIDGAIRAYAKTDIAANYLKEVNTKKKIISAKHALHKEIGSSLQNQNDLINSILREQALLLLVGGEENVNRTYQIYEDCLKADTMNFEIAYNYALYLLNSHNYSNLDQILRYCQLSHNEYDVIRTSILMAKRYVSQKTWGKVGELLEPVYDEIVANSVEKADPNLYLKEKTSISYILTQSYVATRDTIKARNYVKKMLADANYYHEFYNTKDSKRNLVDCLHQAFMYNLKFNIDLKMGVLYLQQAIALQEELYNEEPNRQVAMLAYLHSHLGAIYDNIYIKYPKEEEYYDKMLAEYECACKLYEDAYHANPVAYTTYIIEGYRLLARAYLNHENHIDLEKAKEFIDKSLFYLNKIDKNNKIDISSNSAYYYGDLAFYYSVAKDYKNAEEAAAKAVEYFTFLYNQSPKTYKAILIQNYTRLKKSIAAQNANDTIRLKEIDEKMKSIAK